MSVRTTRLCDRRGRRPRVGRTERSNKLIYRAQNYEGHSKDYEFSRLSMQDHWRAGYHDAVRMLRHPEVLVRRTSLDGVFTFDLERDGRE
jgi:NTE family protein